jgi:hypothetical protein
MKTETGKGAQRGKSLSKKYKWDGQGVKKEKKKGRATGEIVELERSEKKREKKKDAWKEKFINRQ